MAKFDSVESVKAKYEAGERIFRAHEVMILLAYISQLEAAQQSFAPDAANTPRIVEVLDENGNPQKIAVV